MREAMSEKVGDSVTADRPCCISGSREAEVVATRAREGHALRNVMCRESGLIYVDPVPIEDLEQFYKEDYRKSYKNRIVPKGKHIARAGRVSLSRLRQAGDAIRPGMRTLDIGAGGGEWTYLLQRFGCDSQGIEPNRGYGAWSLENYGVDVFLGMYQEANFEKGSFDVVTLFQVLEHLADPVDDLRRMSEYLKPGGKFVIEVPDILFPGMHYRHKWHDGHLFGFDEVTLACVAAKAGLRPCSLNVTPGNLYGIFEKPPEAEPVEVPTLEGHFEEAKAALFAGRRQYWLLSETYTKVFRRLNLALGEKKLVRACDSGRQILDTLYAGVEATG